MGCSSSTSERASSQARVIDTDKPFVPAKHEFSPDVLALTLKDLLIPTSHNSYLSSRAQNFAAANADAVRECLDLGARCVELDIWAGDDGVPVCCHGFSVGCQDISTTTRILLDDALARVSQFLTETGTIDPVFLCFELNDRKSIPLQNNMAALLTKHFGTRLHSGQDLAERPLRDLIGKVLVMSGTGCSTDESNAFYNNVNYFLYHQGYNKSHDDDFAFPEPGTKVGRVYPAGDLKGSLSVNYDPRPFWQKGVTFVALNYQSINKGDPCIDEIMPRTKFLATA